MAIEAEVLNNRVARSIRMHKKRKSGSFNNGGDKRQKHEDEV